MLIITYAYKVICENEVYWLIGREGHCYKGTILAPRRVIGKNVCSLILPRRWIYALWPTHGGLGISQSNDSYSQVKVTLGNVAYSLSPSQHS